MRLRRIGRLPGLRVVGCVIVAAILGALAIAVGSGHWQIRPVLSGSMRPTFPVGGVVVTDREPLADLRVNDVIVTHPPGRPDVDLVHRVIQIESLDATSAVVRTKGDGNAAADPFTVAVHGPWMYRVRSALPLVGYAASALHSALGRRALLLVSALLLLIAAIRSRRQRARGAEQRAAPRRNCGAAAGAARRLGRTGLAAASVVVAGALVLVGGAARAAFADAAAMHLSASTGQVEFDGTACISSWHWDGYSTAQEQTVLRRSDHRGDCGDNGGSYGGDFTHCSKLDPAGNDACHSDLRGFASADTLSLANTPDARLIAIRLNNVGGLAIRDLVLSADAGHSAARETVTVFFDNRIIALGEPLNALSQAPLPLLRTGTSLQPGGYTDMLIVLSGDGTGDEWSAVGSHPDVRVPSSAQSVVFCLAASDR